MNKNAKNLIIKPNRFPHIPKCAGVYMITNKTNNKSYIGSSNDLNKRIGGHFDGQGNGKYINEFNLTECEITVLINCQYLSVNERLQSELECIIRYNTFRPNGYNKQTPLRNRKPIINIKPIKVIEKVKYIKQPKLYKNVIKY